MYIQPFVSQKSEEQKFIDLFFWWKKDDLDIKSIVEFNNNKKTLTLKLTKDIAYQQFPLFVSNISEMCAKVVEFENMEESFKTMKQFGGFFKYKPTINSLWLNYLLKAKKLIIDGGWDIYLENVSIKNLATKEITKYPWKWLYKEFPFALKYKVVCNLKRHSVLFNGKDVVFEHNDVIHKRTISSEDDDIMCAWDYYFEKEKQATPIFGFNIDNNANSLNFPTHSWKVILGNALSPIDVTDIAQPITTWLKNNLMENAAKTYLLSNYNYNAYFGRLLNYETLPYLWYTKEEQKFIESNNLLSQYDHNWLYKGTCTLATLWDKEGNKVNGIWFIHKSWKELLGRNAYDIVKRPTLMIQCELGAICTARLYSFAYNGLKLLKHFAFEDEKELSDFVKTNIIEAQKNFWIYAGKVFQYHNELWKWDFMIDENNNWSMCCSLNEKWNKEIENIFHKKFKNNSSVCIKEMNYWTDATLHWMVFNKQEECKDENSISKRDMVSCYLWHFDTENSFKTGKNINPLIFKPFNFNNHLSYRYGKQSYLTNGNHYGETVINHDILWTTMFHDSICPYTSKFVKSAKFMESNSFKSKYPNTILTIAKLEIPQILRVKNQELFGGLKNVFNIFLKRI